MDKTIVSVIGALSALATLDTAQAASAPPPNVTEIMNAQSFGELLQPIPNAVALLQASDEAMAQAAQSGVKVAQYYYHHHHHHHHHRYYRPY